MWGSLILAGLWVATYVVSRLLAPSPAKKTIPAFVPSRASEGVPVPIYWGRVRISGANLVWFGGVTVDDSGDARGLTRNVLMQYVVGVPGGKQDSTDVSVLNAIWANDQMIMDAPLAHYQTRDIAYSSGQGAISLEMVGQVRYYAGTNNQAIDPFFSLAFESAIDANADTTRLLPNYRLQTMVTFTARGDIEGGFAGVVARELAGGDVGTGFFVGNQQALPQLMFDVSAPTVTDINAPALPNGDANPMAVAYDVLTNPWGRLGISTDLIDTASFEASATTLLTEENGFSAAVYDEQDGRELLNAIMKQVSGVLFEDPTTGQIAVKLIREEFGGLDLDPSNVVEVQQFATSMWTETYNQVRITYTDADRNFTERTAVAQDMANIASQGGKIRSVTNRYLGVSNQALAAKLAARDLHALSIPLMKVRIVVDRDAFQLRPGALVNLTWPDYGLSSTAFRVQRFDLGQLANNRVIMDCIQDRFAADRAVFVSDGDQFTPGGTVAAFPPAVIINRVVTEAPRWVLKRATESNVVVNSEISHGMYLADAEPFDQTFMPKIVVNGAEPYADDASAQVPFRINARVAVAYAREQEPYDTTIGLQIGTFNGDTSVLAVSNSSQITQNGRNLIQVGDELMSYESFTDLGGGTFILNNVWRGLLDTVPVDHAVGELVFFFSSAEVAVPNRRPVGGIGIFDAFYSVGLARLDTGDVASVKLVPRAPDGTLPLGSAFVDTFTTRNRTILPYPGADFRMNGSKFPAGLQDGGYDLTWNRRNYLNDVVLRGDVAPETLPNTVDAYTEYRFVAQKTVEGEVVETVNAVTQDTLYRNALLGVAGHGDMDVMLRSHRVQPGVEFDGWQDPKFSIRAYHWRNLLANARFDDVLTERWVVTEGQLVSLNTLRPLGNRTSNRYAYSNLASTSDETDFNQVVNVSGYLPDRLRAILVFYATQLPTQNAQGASDPNLDEIEVDMDALDSTGAVIGNANTTVSPSATRWDKFEIEQVSLPLGTVSLKARFRLRQLSDVPGDEFPNGAVTEIILRVGQISDQLILNPSFETGLASWTTVLGGFDVLTATQYEGAQYIRGGAFAQSILRQDVAIPAGFEVGATALLEFARMNDGLFDTSQIHLEILDGSSNIVASAHGTNDDVSPLSQWSRVRLFCSMPSDATAVTARVRLVANRFGIIGNANVCFDDMDLRFHKELDPRVVADYRFETPTTVVLPTGADLSVWRSNFPGMPRPKYGIWNGSSFSGVISTQPQLEPIPAPDLATAGNKVCGIWDGAEFAEFDALRTKAYPGFLQTVGNIEWANFNLANDWAVMVVLRHDDLVADVLGGIIWQRLNGQGWSLAYGGGTIGAYVQGTITGAGVSRTSPLTDGGLHMIGIKFVADDDGDAILYVFDEFGSDSIIVTGTGPIQTTLPTPVQHGQFPAAYLRSYFWNNGRADSEGVPEIADFQNFWRHAKDPSGVVAAMVWPSSTEAMAHYAGEDPDGNAILARFAPQQYPIAQVGEARGLCLNSAYTNLTPSYDFQNPSFWTPDVDATFLAVPGVDKVPKEGLRITGNDTNGARQYGIPVTAAPDVRVVWYARSIGYDDTASLVLTDDVGTVKETHAFDVTTQWKEFHFEFTAWDGASATCELKWYPRPTAVVGSIEISMPIVVTQGTPRPVALDLRAGQSPGNSTAIGLIAEPIDVQANHEGEIVIDGGLSEPTGPDAAKGLFAAFNGSDFNDARVVTVTAANEGKFAHYDGASVAVDSTLAPKTDWDAFQVRARWNRLNLLDENTQTNAGIADENGDTDHGRVTAWTPGLVPLNTMFLGGFLDPTAPMALSRVRIRVRERRL